jgi:hypothetical protein
MPPVARTQAFSAKFPTAQQLEYYRLLITLFVDGNPEELFGSVAELQEPPGWWALQSLIWQ